MSIATDLMAMYYAQNADPLPSAYRRVAWLKSDSVQTYINTGIGPSAGLPLEIETRLNYQYRISYGAIFGNYAGENSDCYRLLQTNNVSASAENGYATCGGRANSSIVILHMPRNKWITYNLKGPTSPRCTVTYDGTSQVYSAGEVYGAANYKPIWIGNSGSTPSGSSVGLYIAYYKCWKGGLLVRNMIPVVRNADSKPGLWDMASRAFFVNAGTGNDFTWQEL